MKINLIWDIIVICIGMGGLLVSYYVAHNVIEYEAQLNTEWMLFMESCDCSCLYSNFSNMPTLPNVSLNWHTPHLQEGYNESQDKD